MILLVYWDIAKRPANFEIETMAESIEEFNNTMQIEYLLHEIKEEKPYFKHIINPHDLEDVFAVKVKLDNPRILKQNGAFLLFGISAIQPANIPRNWIARDEKLIIPSGDKASILKELSLLGIDHSTLFPEIEHQGRHLIEKYKA